MHLRIHRGNQGTAEVAVHKSSSVHVLRDEEALREALKRAAEFDQRAAEALLSRSAHYRSLIGDPAAGGPTTD